MENNKKNINRRDFLKHLGAGSLVTAAALSGCKNGGLKMASSAAGEVPTNKMTYRINHNTNDKVSILGYGCMRWPTIDGGSAREQKTQIDQEAVNELVDYALAHGVNYFDTSPVYCQGMSEEATGIALSRHPRDSYFIATKMSNFSNASFENSVAMYKNSFKKLQVDYIDYYLLHNIGGDVESFNHRFIDNGLLDFLIEERKAGRIRNLGWSFHGYQSIFDHILAYHEKVHWDFIQIQMNYSDWRSARGRNVNAEYLYAELEKRNIPVVIMEPLLGGRLANVHAHIAEILKQRRPDLSIASWAFRFAGTHPHVLSVLSGMPYMEHLKENVETYSPLEPLTQDDMDFLDSTAQKFVRYPLIPCNDCKYCMPCPYGIDIPAILLHFNKCINEDRMPVSSMDDNYRELRKGFLIGYDRSVPKLRQADHCIGCNQCVKKCPQRINIPKQMRRIDKFVEALKQGKEFDDKTNYLWSR